MPLCPCPHASWVHPSLSWVHLLCPCSHAHFDRRYDASHTTLAFSSMMVQTRSSFSAAAPRHCTPPWSCLQWPRRTHRASFGLHHRRLAGSRVSTAYTESPMVSLSLRSLEASHTYGLREMRGTVPTKLVSGLTAGKLSFLIRGLRLLILTLACP